MYGERFPAYVLPTLCKSLEGIDFNQASILMAQTKDPLVSLLLSLFLGTLGIDRFYIGDTLLGALKLITCGGCGIWSIIDLFLIMGAAREKNYAQFNGVLL